MTTAPRSGRRRLTSASVRRAHPPSDLGRDDRGALAVELSILFPMVLALTLGGVQAAMWYQARNMCQAAAQTGARAARVLTAPGDAGTAAADAYLAATAKQTVTDARTTQAVTATTVTVTCSGDAERVFPLPGLTVRVSQSATAPRERFIP